MKKIFYIILVLIGSYQVVYAKDQYASLAGSVSQFESGDSVTISLSKYGYVISEPLTEERIIKVPILNHRFHIKIPLGNIPLFLDLRFNSMRNIEPLVGYIIERGDAINMRIDTGGYGFSGRGVEKFNVLYKLNAIKNIDFKGIGIDLGKPSGLAQVQIKTNRTTIHQLAYLDSRKAFLSVKAFALVAAHIYGFYLGEVSSTYYNQFLNQSDSLRRMALNSIRNIKNESVAGYPDDKYNSNPILKYSGEYSSGIILKYQLDSCYLTDRRFVFEKCYQYIKNNYKGGLRDRILTNLFFYYRYGGQDMEASVNDAIKFIKDKHFARLINRIKASNVTGAKAFEFNLLDTNGIKHSLAQYKGKVVVLDFWYRGCGNCIRIAPYLEVAEKKFYNRSVVFLSINVDKRRDLWIKGIKSGNYNSKYVVNLFTDGLGLKHAMCRHYQVNGCPTLLLIDRKGTLMKSPVDPRYDAGQDLFDSIGRGLIN